MYNAKKSRIWWILYFFLLFFSPPIISGLHTFFIVALFSMFFLVLKRKKDVSRVLKESGLRKWLLYMLLFSGYTYVVFTINYLFLQESVQTSHYITLINRFVALFVTVVPCVLYVIIENEKNNNSLFFILENICYSALIETIFCVLAFLNPTIKMKLIDIMNAKSSSNIYENAWYITVRSYGFADTLVDVFGLGVAVIAGVCLFYGVIYKKKFIIISFLIVISSLFNSRTGVFLYVLSLLLVFVFMLIRGRAKYLMYYLVGLLALILIVKFGIDVVNQNEATSGWIENGYKSIQMLFKNGEVKNESLGAMTTYEFYQLPDILHSVFGTGHSRYGAAGYSHTDSGYINDIWLAGIVGCLILYSQFFAIAVKTYKQSNLDFIKLTMIYIICCFLVFNIKASVVGGNIGAFALFSLLFIYKYYAKKI